MTADRLGTRGSTPTDPRVLLTPLGGSLAAVPLLGMLAAAFLGTAAGFAYIGRLMKNSTRLYAKWLGR